MHNLMLNSNLIKTNQCILVYTFNHAKYLNNQIIEFEKKTINCLLFDL